MSKPERATKFIVCCGVRAIDVVQSTRPSPVHPAPGEHDRLCRPNFRGAALFQIGELPKHTLCLDLFWSINHRRALAVKSSFEERAHASRISTASTRSPHTQHAQHARPIHSSTYSSDTLHMLQHGQQWQDFVCEIWFIEPERIS